MTALPSMFYRYGLGLLVPLLLLGSGAGLEAQTSPAGALRPMTFLDMQHVRSWGSPTVHPEGRYLLHTVTTPIWDDARSQTDIYLVPLNTGVADARRLTFTEDRNETQPTWSPDGSFFIFLSNRDAPANAQGRSQLYRMRTDGGEAQRITDAAQGVNSFAFSPDGQWLVFRSGSSGEEQLFRLPADLDGSLALPSKGEAITRHPAGVRSWEFMPGGGDILFIAPEALDADNRRRRERGFTVNIQNEITPLHALWSVPVAGGEARAMANDPSFSVERFTISADGRWVAFVGESSNRYRRNITESGLNADLYLLNAGSGAIERLTESYEVSFGGPSFSPDGRWIAFTAPADLSRYSMANRHVYLRETANVGGDFRILGRSFDGNLSLNFWSADGRTIYFNEGIRATRQLLALDLERDEVRQLTQAEASLSVSRDDITSTLLVSYQDPTTPSTLFTAPSIEALADRSRWTQLTDVNPQIREIALGASREITWTSSDGVSVGGVLTLPVGYEPGRRYPLIVAIHGGPASADVLGFNGGYGSQVYAGDGYVVLKPNYRGSTNYGEAFRTGIVGNYFPPGYEDIITGVDYLIAEGIVDGERMGALGWSAGGHWSNWILVNTDRFRAISSGAGTSNWISMYAQSDVQRNRQFYLGNRLPYEDFDAYWDQSPLQYITRARTPTMIHVVEGDPRVPSAQSVELHMALRQLGVPTELFLYPGNTHGIPDPRNRLLKSVSEKAWMDYYVRGQGSNFTWEQVLSTLPTP